MKYKFLEFWHKDKALCKISLDGLFGGEIKATKELLAQENNCEEDEIVIKAK